MKAFARKLRFFLIRLLRQKHGAHKISLGFVVGFYPCWFPTLFVGPIISVGLTKFVKGNLTSAIFAASLGSFLWPFLFYFNYIIGTSLNKLYVNLRTSTSTSTSLNMEALDQWDPDYIHISEQIGFWSRLGSDFLLGFFVNSTFFTIIGYFAIRFMIIHYRLSMLRMIRTNAKNNM